MQWFRGDTDKIVALHYRGGVEVNRQIVLRPFMSLYLVTTSNKDFSLHSRTLKTPMVSLTWCRVFCFSSLQWQFTRHRRDRPVLFLRICLPFLLLDTSKGVSWCRKCEGELQGPFSCFVAGRPLFRPLLLSIIRTTFVGLWVGGVLRRRFKESPF